MVTLKQFGDTAYPLTKPPVAAPILAATDGTEQSEAALRIARLLADRDHSPVRVLTVVEPVANTAPAFEVAFANTVLDEHVTESVRERACLQVARTVPGTCWDCDVTVGDPAECIAQKAEQLEAGLIVVGLGRHRFIDRLLGGETALRLIRRSRVPVLAVASELETLPQTAVVAIDFGQASIAAARLAVRLVGEGGRVFLVHVIPPNSASNPDRSWTVLHEARVIQRLGRLAKQLRDEGEAGVETRVLRGTPARRIPDFAREMGVDMIAVGPHGHDFFARLVAGDVSGRMMRTSSCSVLAFPRRAVDAEHDAILAAAEARRDARIAADEWPARLAEFDSRNVGRRARLEIDSLEFGAQSELAGYAFYGAAYDPYDAAISVMFGDAAGGESHLTHSVRDVRAVDILPDPADPDLDLALRVGHEGGQTLVIFDAQRT